MNRIRALLVTSRPRFWLYLAGPVLVGISYGARTPADLVTISTVLLFAYVLFPANLFLYGINDIFDRRIDLLNPKKTSGPERRYAGEKTVRWATIGAGILGVPVLLIIPRESAPWLLGFLVLAAAYSAPPFRFKSTPFLDSLSNGLYVLPGVAAYVTLAESLPPVSILVGAWLWTMAMHTFSAIPDIDPDRAAGIQTTATVFGRDGTSLYCAIVWSLAAVGFGIVDWRLGTLLAVYPILLVIIHIWRIPVDRAYWWYPWINGVIGMVLTLGGLWRLGYA